MEAWREEYNRGRPHSALGYLTPEKFAAKVVTAASATPQQQLQHTERELILT
ncbi:MAG: transposase [Candidatus Hydrogenedentota bacterium]|nr:MAG: transposase [Candidatus Hydrogenedentota bacterium]